jgi:hypothetical protein
MRAVLAHWDAAGSAACALVGLVATVAVPCAVFAVAFSLCLWALGTLGKEKTPANVLAACNESTPGCFLAALWHSRDVLARLFAVSFYLFCVLLLHGADDVPEEDEVREVSRGRTTSASTRQRRFRRAPRSLAARETTETTAEHVCKIAPGTAGPSSVLPGTGRSTMSRHATRASPSRSAPQGPDASRSRSASLARSTGPRWNLSDAVFVSLSRSISGPLGEARRASKESKDPSGQRVPPKRAPQGPDASRSRSASLARSSGLRWSLRDAVLVSMSRSISGPLGEARRASKEPTGQRRRTSPTGTSRRTSPTGTSRRTSPTGTSRRTSPTGTSRRGVSSGSLFYENVVLRQLKDQAYAEPSDEGDNA